MDPTPSRPLRLPEIQSTRGYISSVAHTVHPSIHEVLQTPRAQIRARRADPRVTGSRRGPPGPPPPGSWLHRRENVKRPIHTPFRDHTKEIETLPGWDMPSSGSLLDRAFESLARNWEEHAYYDQYHLATLPVRHKEILLHYIAIYGSSGIDIAGLEVLFLDAKKLEGATGIEGLTRFDLSTSIGRSLSFRDMKRFFTRNTIEAQESHETLAESWENLSPVALLPSQPKFHALTHLSLSHPSSSATWRDLLDFAPNLISLTHLSLAYWPTPTLTPNSLTAFTVTPSGSVSYGASNFYSEFDNDWSEAASILRRLSRNTICLQWLDLTGCYPWLQCLSYPDIPWYGAWACMTTLKIGQGHPPSCLHQVHRMKKPEEGTYTGAASAPGTDEPSPRLDQYSLTPQQIEELVGWVAQEKRLQQVEKAVRARIRTTSSGNITSAGQKNRRSALSDEWPRAQQLHTPRTVARTSVLHFDYGWQDPRIVDAIGFVERL
ncbi:MAG: hypothetical protein Q9163_000478 [Psora crenata]